MMKKMFRFAAMLALLVNSAPIFAADAAVKSAPAPVALGELLSGSLSDLAVLPVPEEIKIPEALPASADKAAGMAPKPGKDFTPVVQDKARIKAIMQLVSDVYNGKQMPYSQDGTTFKNKEGRLPAMPLGFYKEYTLLTGDAPHVVTIGGTTYQVAPDLSARGSERVIIGGGEKIYYTPDHYKNFILLTVVY